MWNEQDGWVTIVVWSCGSLLICDRFGISIPMLILQRRSLSMPGSLLMGGWVRRHCLAMALAYSQDSCWRIGRVSILWKEVWNRKWHWVRIPMLPFLRWWVTLLLMSSIISSFLVTYVAYRVWFRKFHNSQVTSHSFLMSKEIHIFPEFFSPSGWRWRFWISAHLFARIPMRACSQPILV